MRGLCVPVGAARAEAEAPRVESGVASVEVEGTRAEDRAC